MDIKEMIDKTYLSLFSVLSHEPGISVVGPDRPTKERLAEIHKAVQILDQKFNDQNKGN